MSKSKKPSNKEIIALLQKRVEDLETTVRTLQQKLPKPVSEETQTHLDALKKAYQLRCQGASEELARALNELYRRAVKFFESGRWKEEEDAKKRRWRSRCPRNVFFMEHPENLNSFASFVEMGVGCPWPSTWHGFSGEVKQLHIAYVVHHPVLSSYIGNFYFHAPYVREY